jgi:nucleoside-diphosphate-sugar epimerase
MIRVLIVGAGDVARRLLPLLVTRKSAVSVAAVVRRSEAAIWWRAQGVRTIHADLDQRADLERIAGWADWVVHLAPPPAAGHSDTRTRRLLAALGSGRRLPQRLVYISTTGVYGDRGGGRVDETTPGCATTDRARRRADAEAQVRRFGRETGCRVSILRVPGIYAGDRLPVERLRAGTPALIAEDDAYTNHIHADDLARAIVAALRRGRCNRIYNAVDDSAMKMGDWFDTVADATGLPRPARLSRDEVRAAVSPAMWSYLAESRRIGNRRLKTELEFRLRYPTVRHALFPSIEH